jgi:hypothetical protein
MQLRLTFDLRGHGTMIGPASPWCVLRRAQADTKPKAGEALGN